MDKSDLLAAFERESDDMLEALRLGLDAPVPGCPEWNTGQLAGHVAGVYGAWDYRVRNGARGEFDPAEAFAPYSGLFEWLSQGTKRESTPSNVLDLLGLARDRIRASLAQADPRDPVKTWFPPDQTAGFVQRRMAQESAVHRWDAQSAHGVQKPIEGELARDGIDEVLDIHMPMLREWQKAPEGNDETFHFHRTDGPGEWFVEFPATGQPVVRREHQRAGVAVRASASDLLLWLWGRIPDDQLDVAGDERLLPRWRQLVPFE